MSNKNKLTEREIDSARLAFLEYDKDGSGSIDYDEFRHVWAIVANVRQELANRGQKFSKFVPTYILRRRLKKILDEEEDRESEALAHAKAWKKYQDMFVVCVVAMRCDAMGCGVTPWKIVIQQLTI